VSKLLQVALGILAAIGGFVDIGDIVFNTTAGATFGYQMLWIVALGAIGIIFMSEMCGRVATVTRRPVYDAVRNRFGLGAGLAALVASTGVNLLTCIAEVGGMALCLQLLTGWLYRPLVLVAALILVVSVWLLPFEWIERVYGFGGLLLLAFTVAALDVGVDWGRFAHGFVPHVEHTHSWLIWGYFAVGLFSATLMPYEIYFYSSGAIEEQWQPPTDLRINAVTAVLGFGLGAFLSFSLIALSASLFMPLGIEPQFLGTVALGALDPLGKAGLLIGLAGILFAVGGAAVDTALSGGYAIAQFLGWPWGKLQRPKHAARFSFAWIAFVAAAAIVSVTGVNPIEVTEYSVIFGVVAMPLSYLPVLLVAQDRDVMGEHANGLLLRVVGWFYFVLICVLALAAVPLLVLTNLGQG
jgi:manganese transport protein